MNKTLYDVKVGDKVLFDGDKILIVSGITETQIITAHHKFLKRNGRMIGDGSTICNHQHIVANISEEDLARVQERRNKEKLSLLKTQCSELIRGCLSIEKLENVIKILN